MVHGGCSGSYLQRDIHQLAREGTHQAASILRSEGCTSTRCIGFCIRLLGFLRYVPSALGAVWPVRLWGPWGCGVRRARGEYGGHGGCGSLEAKSSRKIWVLYQGYWEGTYITGRQGVGICVVKKESLPTAGR